MPLNLQVTWDAQVLIWNNWRLVVTSSAQKVLGQLEIIILAIRHLQDSLSYFGEKKIVNLKKVNKDMLIKIMDTTKLRGPYKVLNLTFSET